MGWEWMTDKSGDLPATDGLKEKLKAMIQQFLGFVSVYWIFCVLDDQHILTTRVS